MENEAQTTAVTEETKVLTFEEMLGTNGYQKEFDKRLSKAMNTNANTLTSQFNETLAQRDKDIEELKKAVQGNADLEKQFNDLQGKYSKETEDYKNQLAKQAYEFAVKQAVNEVKFSSKMAKEFFTAKAIEKGLTMNDNGAINGFDDFVKYHKEQDPSSFVIEEKEPEKTPVPEFTKPITNSQVDNNPFNFNFTGVREIPKN